MDQQRDAQDDAREIQLADHPQTIQVQLRTHPDGGVKAWIIVLAAFFVQFIAVGLQNSSGVLYTALVDEYQKSKGETAMVGSIGIGMMFFCGPLSTSLCERYGCRIVACTGAFLCIFGLFMSSFAQSLHIMYITYGVTWGLGTSLCYFPTLIILVEYFDKRLALVNGIVSSGSGLGTFAISPLLTWTIHEVGVFNSLRVLGGLHIICFVSGLLFRPVGPEYAALQERPTDKDSPNAEPKSTEPSVWLEKTYAVWTLALSTFMLGYFVPFVHLVRHAVLIGVNDSKASFLIGILSILSTGGKVVMGRIADMKTVNKLCMYQFGLLIMSISTTLVPIGRGYPALVGYAVVFGLSESCFVVLIPLLTKEIVGIKRLSSALGSLFMIMAIPTMLGPPVAGWLYEASGDYATAFYVAGAFMTAGVLLMYLIPLFNEQKYRDEELKQVLINEEPASSAQEPSTDGLSRKSNTEKSSGYAGKSNGHVGKSNGHTKKSNGHVKKLNGQMSKLSIKSSSVWTKDSSLRNQLEPQIRLARPRSQFCIFACWPPQGRLHDLDESDNEDNDRVVVDKVSSL